MPASVSIAQAILESEWGRSGLAKIAKNLFGIKADVSWMGPSRAMPTEEVRRGKTYKITAKFRAYRTFTDSINDHARFLSVNPRYHKAFLTTGGPNFAKEIAKAGYATDPDYAEKLVNLIRHYDLEKYDVPQGSVATPKAAS